MWSELFGSELERSQWGPGGLFEAGVYLREASPRSFSFSVDRLEQIVITMRSFDSYQALNISWWCYLEDRCFFWLKLEGGSALFSFLGLTYWLHCKGWPCIQASVKWLRETKYRIWRCGTHLPTARVPCNVSSHSSHWLAREAQRQSGTTQSLLFWVFRFSLRCWQAWGRGALHCSGRGAWDPQWCPELLPYCRGFEPYLKENRKVKLQCRKSWQSPTNPQVLWCLGEEAASLRCKTLGGCFSSPQVIGFPSK